jgi:hypothetical protein
VGKRFFTGSASNQWAAGMVAFFVWVDRRGESATTANQDDERKTK